ncbi:hypothetical protein WJX84_007659 [Apatococcus fuscideae]|uniref:Protein Asterix n=1 Tax=Apatococcus fuscideae TaxID=2026836 RepID=A0AAW1T4U7_9CHLO
MAYQFKISGDPKKPGDTRKMDKPPEEEAQSDPIQLLAMMLGMVGMMLKVKMASWGALLCCLSAVANMKSFENDLKQIISTATFAVFGINPPRWLVLKAT